MMMPITLMDVPMFQLFTGWLAQPDHLHVEMQFIPRQWMIEIEGHVVTLDRLDTGVSGLPRVIPNR